MWGKQVSLKSLRDLNMYTRALKHCLDSDGLAHCLHRLCHPPSILIVYVALFIILKSLFCGRREVVNWTERQKDKQIKMTLYVSTIGVKGFQPLSFLLSLNSNCWKLKNSGRLCGNYSPGVLLIWNKSVLLWVI